MESRRCHANKSCAIVERILGSRDTLSLSLARARARERRNPSSRPYVTQNRRVFGARSTPCCYSLPVNGRLTSLTRRGSPSMARDAPTTCFSRESLATRSAPAPYSWLSLVCSFALIFFLLFLLTFVVLVYPSPLPSHEDRCTLVKMLQLVIRRHTRTRSKFEMPPSGPADSDVFRFRARLHFPSKNARLAIRRYGTPNPFAASRMCVASRYAACSFRS